MEGKGPVVSVVRLPLREELQGAAAVAERCAAKDCRSLVALTGRGLRKAFGRETDGLDRPTAAALASLSALSLPLMPSCPVTQRRVTRVPGCAALSCLMELWSMSVK